MYPLWTEETIREGCKVNVSEKAIIGFFMIIALLLLGYGLYGLHQPITKKMILKFEKQVAKDQYLVSITVFPEEYESPK